MALPLHPAFRESSKRRLPSFGPGEAQLSHALGLACCSPPKVKARRIEAPTGSLVLSDGVKEISRAANPRARSPLTSPLKRRLQSSLDGKDERSLPTSAAAVAAAEVESPASNLLRSPVRLHFPLSSAAAKQAGPQLPPFPSAASSCVAPVAATASDSSGLLLSSPARRQRPRGGAEAPQGKRITEGPPAAPLPFGALSLLTTAAAAAAAAAGSGRCQEPTDASPVLQERPSFLAEAVSPFSASRRRKDPAAVSAAAISREAVVAAAAATPSSVRRTAVTSRDPDGDTIDYKTSPVSSRRRASPYHSSSSSGSAAAAGLDAETLSPFRLTPPRKKPLFSFYCHPGTQTKPQQQQQQQQQQAAEACELRMTPQHIALLQRLFAVQQQQRKEGFCCNSVDSLAAAEAPLAAVKLSRQLERLRRLYGLLRILFDRLHDRGEPLLLFSVILPAYSKLALTHQPRSASESPLHFDSSNSSSSSSSSSSGSMYGMSGGRSKVRNDLVKDVGRLVWLVPQLLQWRPRRLQWTTGAAAAAAMLSPQQQQQQQYDIQMVELKDGVQLAARARDSEQRQQQLYCRLIAYTLQWQNCCLQQQQQQQQDKVLLLRKSRELLMQEGRWVPGFNVETVPSPPSAAPPELKQQPLRQLLPQQPPGAFRGDTLIGTIGGSPLRCTLQQPQKPQQQEQADSKVMSPDAAPVALSSASSVDCCGRPQASSPLLPSPLSRGRDPLRRLPLLSSRLAERSPSLSLDRRSTSNSTSPTRSPVSERLRRKTEERMAGRRKEEAAKQLRRELYDNLQRLTEAQVVLQCLLDACVYQDRRSRIDIRVLTDLFVSKVVTPLPPQAVERAVLLLESLAPSSIHLRSNVITLDATADPSALRKTLDAKLQEAEAAALAADPK